MARHTAERFLAFCELELTHAPGPAPGRYVTEPGTDGVADVLIFEVAGAPPPPMLPRLRGTGARAVDRNATAPEVPLAFVRLVRPGVVLAGEAQARSLAEDWRGSDELREAWVAEALAACNRATRAFRIVAQNPYVHEIGRADPRGVRLGWGTAGDVDRGFAEELLELRGGRTPRLPVGERLAPDETVAALLRGRRELDDCHDVHLRGLLDLVEGRLVGAAAQLEAGLQLALARADALEPRSALVRRLADLCDDARDAGSRETLTVLADASRPVLLELRELELREPWEASARSSERRR